jgi:hypothetical protein
MNDTTNLPKTFANSNLVELRKEDRLSMHFPSLLIAQKEEIYTTVINLSENGIGFLSAIKVTEDDEVEISFECVNDHTNPRVNLTVRVRSCKEIDHEYHIGGRLISKPLNYTKFFKIIELGATAPVKLETTNPKD